MRKSVEVRQYMLNKPVSVKPEMTIFEASHQILAHKISGVCVVDDQNILVGMLSELDCMRAIISSAYNDNEPSGSGMRVQDIMTREVDVNHPDDDIVGVASQMLERRQRRRPIVEDGKLVGQLTCRQILKASKEFVSPEDPSER
jgi:CBS domain-containing protein